MAPARLSLNEILSDQKTLKEFTSERGYFDKLESVNLCHKPENPKSDHRNLVLYPITDNFPMPLKSRPPSPASAPVEMWVGFRPPHFLIQKLKCKVQVSS